MLTQKNKKFLNFTSMIEYLKPILNAFYDLLFVFTADGTIEDYTAADREEEFLHPQEAWWENITGRYYPRM